MRFDPQSNFVATEENAPCADAPAGGEAEPGARSLKIGAVPVVATSFVLLAIWFWGVAGPGTANAGTGGQSRAAVPKPAVTPGAVPLVVYSTPPVAEIVDATPDPGSATDAAPRAVNRERSLEALEKGRALMLTGRHAEAIPHLMEAVQNDPGHADAKYKLGLACVMTGDRATARRMQRELEAIDPSLSNLIDNLLR